MKPYNSLLSQKNGQDGFLNDMLVYWNWCSNDCDTKKSPQMGIVSSKKEFGGTNGPPIWFCNNCQTKWGAAICHDLRIDLLIDPSIGLHIDFQIDLLKALRIDPRIDSSARIDVQSMMTY